MRKLNLIAVAIVLGTSLAGCSPKSSEPSPTASGPIMVVQGAVNCQLEDRPLPKQCNEGLNGNPILQLCPAEDDANDGTPGPKCYWVDPDTGNLWYNDGDGYVSSLS